MASIPTNIRVEWGDLTIHDCSDESVPYALLAEGFDLGSPVTTYEAIASLMTDGSFQSSPGHSNRENLALPIQIRFDDTAEAADLAQALELEAGKPFNELRFYQGDDTGAVTVLDTFPANLTGEPWEVFAEGRGERTIRANVPALPFARALNTETINWTDIGTRLDDMSALTGWTWSGAAASVAGPTGTGIYALAPTSTTGTGTKTFTISGDYLWVWSKHGTSTNDSAITAVSVNGTVIDPATWSPGWSGTNSGKILCIPVDRWRGQTVPVTFTFAAVNGSLFYPLWAVDYPNKQIPETTETTRPLGIGVIDVKGSARTGCRISFTAPAAGAFVYTAPDPSRALREYGAGEVVFADFTVSASGGAEISINGWVIWYPAGDHTAMIGMSDPQPIEINPNGVWPQVVVGAISGTGYTGVAYPYPQDTRASVSFFETTGAKNLISPSPQVPQGYVGDATAHEPHALHPDRCGFAVLNASTLAPIATTITYYPRNWIWAAH